MSHTIFLQKEEYHLSNSSKSIFFYCLYLGSSGLMLAFFPDFMLGLLHQSTTDPKWVRVFGFLAAVLAAKGIYVAAHDQRGNMQFDVYTRLAFSVFFVILIVKGQFAPIMCIFAIADFVGAVWTVIALAQDRKADAMVGTG